MELQRFKVSEQLNVWLSEQPNSKYWHILPDKERRAVFHEFFRLFRQEFTCDKDFQDFISEEYSNIFNN